MSNRSKAQILVVDDDPRIAGKPGNVADVCWLRRRHGRKWHQCRVALERVLPDLIVTDLNMPQMSGIELISHVRSLPVGFDCRDERRLPGDAVPAACRRQVLPQRRAPDNLLATIASLIATSTARGSASEARTGRHWILRQGGKYAWNYLDCSSGFVSGRCSPEVESQPFLGLLPERRIGSSPRRRGYFAVAWPDLIAGCRLDDPNPVLMAKRQPSRVNSAAASNSASS